jgi:hypothetical protein
MPRLKPNAVPAHRLHRQSGQAIVTLSVRDILLGEFDSPASRAAYDLSVTELIVRYWEHARSYYAASRELDNIRHALRPLK